MPRQYIFRGKRVDTGEWVMGYYIKYAHPNEEHWIYVYGGLGFIVHPATLGQSTGLFDKNGKEIYEGDVVKYTHRFGDKGYIYYSKDYASFNIDLTGSMNGVFDNLHEHIGDLEIIGTIHDKPILIDKE